MKLLLNALTKYLLGVILLGLFIFLPAGSFCFFNGWLLIGVLFIPMLIIGIILFIKDKELLNRRLESKEKIKKQDVIVKLSGLVFIVSFIIAGLDYRYTWINLPIYIPIIFSIIFLIGYLMYFEVLRENTYLSRTIKVENNQKVIDTGLYGIVRHPMYTSTILMFLSIPLILGSLIAFLIFLLYPVLIIVILLNEEKVLEEELSGYKEYKQKVKYRLIPFIW